MNYLIMLIIVGFALAPLLLAQSYSQTPEISVILVKTTLRDSDGNLVAHLESTKFTDVNFDALNSFLDFQASMRDEPVYEVGDKKLQVIKRVAEITIEKESLVASTLLLDTREGKNTLLARFAHDGYPVAPGDSVTSEWIFVRQV